MRTIIFDDGCVGWTRHSEMNRVFVTTQIEYIRTEFAYRGYVYMSDIYDIFGARWDPHDENKVWIKDENELHLECECISDETIEIKIW